MTIGKKQAPEKEASQLLMQAFSRLKKKNPSLSIRALAPRCQLSPSYLSKLLRGVKAITFKQIPILAKVFDLDFIEVRELQRLTLSDLEAKEAFSATGFKVISDQKSNYKEYKKLSHQDFFLLNEWYYIPLLNLVTMDSFEAEPVFIARKLGISERTAESALRELFIRGYLKRNEISQKVERTELKVRFPTSKSHEIVREYHKKMIDRSVKELKNTSQEAFDHRLISGLSFAGSSEKIQEAKAILNEAIYKASALLMEDSKITEVFQINLQFFSLTRDK